MLPAGPCKPAWQAQAQGDWWNLLVSHRRIPVSSPRNDARAIEEFTRRGQAKQHREDRRYEHARHQKLPTLASLDIAKKPVA